MITLPNDVSFEYVVGSGALGFDGNGYWYDRPFLWTGLIDRTPFLVTTKTIKWMPKAGNRSWFDWTGRGCIRVFPGGAHNAVGLTGPGFDAWEKIYAPKLPTHLCPVAVSIHGTPEECAAMAARLNVLPIAAIELNVSCPNTDAISEVIAIVEAVRRVTSLPLILKLRADYDLEAIMEHIGDRVAAVSLNSVPWGVVYPGRRSPLEKLGGGGVSGRPAQFHNWNAVARIADLNLVPVIAPSIMSVEGMETVREHYGASAVSMCAAFMPCPYRPWTWFKPADPTYMVCEDQRRQKKRREQSANAVKA